MHAGASTDLYEIFFGSHCLFIELKFKRGAATGGFLTACAHEFLFRGYAVKFLALD